MTFPQQGGVNLGSAYGQIVISDNIDSALGNAQRAFDNALSGIGQRMQHIGQTMSNVGQQITIATAPLAVFGAQGIRTASRYEDAMKEIEVRAGLTAEQLAMVEERTRQIGLESQYGPAQAADAFLQLLSSGSSVEEAMLQIDGVIQGASASGQELGYVADALTDVMAAFGLEAENSTDVMQTLINASNSSSATFNDLIDGFANVGPAALNAGLSVEETAAALAVFAENGIKGSEGGTQLKTVLTQLQSTRAAQELERLGVSITDMDGNIRPLNDIIVDLNASMDGMSEFERNQAIQELVGSYGQLGLSALLASGGIDDMVLTMGEQADIADVAEARMSTFSGAIEFLRGSIELLQITALRPLMDEYLRPMVLQVSDVVNRITEWIQANPELAGTIVRILAVLTVLGPILVVVGQAISIIGGALAALASPVGLIILAIGALGVAFATNFMGIRDAVAGAVGYIMQYARPAFDRLVSVLSSIWTEAQPGLQQLGNWFVSDVMPQITGIVMTAVSNLLSLATWLGAMWTIARPSLEALGQWFLTDGLAAIGDYITGTALPFIQRLIDTFGRVWTDVSPFLLQLFDWFMNTGLPMIRDFVIDDVMPVVSNFIGLLGNIWTKVQPHLASLYNWFISTGLPAILEYIEGDFTTGLENSLATISTFLANVNDAITAVNNLMNGTALTEGLGNTSVGQFANNLSNRDYGQIARDAIQNYNPFGMMPGMGMVNNALGSLRNNIFGQGGVQVLSSTTSRDSGGQGIAGMPYLIGAGAQPELFIPQTNGQFIPNADELMGGGKGIVFEPGSIVVNANDAEGGRAAGEAFSDTLMERLRAEGYPVD